MIGARCGRLFLLALFAARSAGAADDAPVIGWEEAARHLGREVVVEGRVMGVHCGPLACLLAFEPTFNGFTAVVQAEHFDLFPPADLEARFAGRRVRVRGTVVDRDKKPEIVVAAREALALVDAPAPSDDARAGLAQAEAEALERVADVLERIEALTERLAAVQERMEVVLARLEEREGALAAGAGTPAETAPAPTDGSPQPRPSFEALRTIKRGMGARDVARLVGEPQSVEPAANGWTTWHYGYGRSVSFDARGRARSLVGFPPP